MFNEANNTVTALFNKLYIIRMVLLSLVVVMNNVIPSSFSIESNKRFVIGYVTRAGVPRQRAAAVTVAHPCFSGTADPALPQQAVLSQQEEPSAAAEAAEEHGRPHRGAGPAADTLREGALAGPEQGAISLSRVVSVDVGLQRVRPEPARSRVSRRRRLRRRASAPPSSYSFAFRSAAPVPSASVPHFVRALGSLCPKLTPPAW